MSTSIFTNTAQGVDTTLVQEQVDRFPLFPHDGTLAEMLAALEEIIAWVGRRKEHAVIMVSFL